MLEQIYADDFKVIKAEASEKLRVLEAKLTETPNRGDNLQTIEGLLDIVIERYPGVQLRYKKACVVEKRKMIVSMYSKNSVLTE